MMGAVQPFISGAISKTVNLPEDVTVEDVEQLHIDAWRWASRRSPSTATTARWPSRCRPPRRTDAEDGADDVPRRLRGRGPRPGAQREDRRSRGGAGPRAGPRPPRRVVVGAVRERLPRRRKSSTFAFRVADCEGYVTVGEYEDGRPGEVFMKVSKQGSTLAGIMDAFSISVSLGLQHGVPWPPMSASTPTCGSSRPGSPTTPICGSPPAWSTTSSAGWRWTTCPLDERAELGVLSTSERMQPTLPGVEETATTSSGVVEAESSTSSTR